MIGTFTRWRENRQRRDEKAVLAAIGMLRPSRASGYPISRLAHIGVARAYPALARLENSGRVVSEWAEGSKPRRRVYRAVSTAEANR